MVVIYRLFILCAFMQNFLKAVRAVPFLKMEQARGIKNDHPVLPQEPCVFKLPSAKECMYHLPAEFFQLPRIHF